MFTIIFPAYLLKRPFHFSGFQTNFSKQSSSMFAQIWDCQNLAEERTAIGLDVHFGPTRSGRGGGGERMADDQTDSCQSGISYSMMPKLCDF